jgi:CheY-like chemotaxis protein
MAKCKKILLAEDSENDIELTLRALEECSLGDEVYAVRDGGEALDYLYSRNQYGRRAGGLPGLVLLDLKMPRVDGLEVLRAVKSDAALSHLPVVMLTSSREESDLVRSYALGVNAFVVKPVDARKFAAAIKSIAVFWALINELPPDERPGN